MRKRETECGVRYSILLSLPYFDSVRFTKIDIMHNLYLGTGKRVFKIWIEDGILSASDLNVIDERSQSFRVPNNTGRLPTNIASNYGGFKAAQW